MRYLKRVMAARLATGMFMCVAAGNLAAQSTTVIIVRHAEKAAAPADDPPLTAAGETRAKALWDVVKDAGAKR